MPPPNPASHLRPIHHQKNYDRNNKNLRYWKYSYQSFQLQKSLLLVVPFKKKNQGWIVRQ